MSKLTAFTSSMYNAATHQVRHHIVLARRARKYPIFDDVDEWVFFCSGNAEVATPERGCFMKGRDIYARRYAEWAKKDERIIKRVVQKPRRTPYRQDTGPQARWGGILKTPKKWRRAHISPAHRIEVICIKLPNACFGVANVRHTSQI